jgi:hypothetical protein
MKKQKKEHVKRNKEHLEIKKRENKVLYGVLYYMMKRDEKEMKRCYCYV